MTWTWTLMMSPCCVAWQAPAIVCWIIMHRPRQGLPGPVCEFSPRTKFTNVALIFMPHLPLAFRVAIHPAASLLLAFGALCYALRPLRLLLQQTVGDNRSSLTRCFCCRHGPTPRKPSCEPLLSSHQLVRECRLGRMRSCRTRTGHDGVSGFMVTLRELYWQRRSHLLWLSIEICRCILAHLGSRDCEFGGCRILVSLQALVSLHVVDHYAFPCCEVVGLCLFWKKLVHLPSFRFLAPHLHSLVQTDRQTDRHTHTHTHTHRHGHALPANRVTSLDARVSKLCLRQHQAVCIRRQIQDPRHVTQPLRMEFHPQKDC